MIYITPDIIIPLDTYIPNNKKQNAVTIHRLKLNATKNRNYAYREYCYIWHSNYKKELN